MKKAVAAVALLLASAGVWWAWPLGREACVEPPLPEAIAGLFDLAALRDPSTLAFEVLATDRVTHGTESVVVRRVRFRSFEWRSCAWAPVDVEAYLALPASAVGTRSGRLPGLVRLHGLAPLEEKANAAAWAAEAGFATLATFTDGRGPNDVFAESPRTGFFARHVVNAMRGLTVLAAQPEVDDTKLATHGLSAGGIATMLVGAIDDRVKASTVWFAAGHPELGAAAQPNPAWTSMLLAQRDPPLGYDSTAWRTHVAWFDPAKVIRPGHPDTLLIGEAQDPFFPLDATVATMRDFERAGVTARLDVVVGFGHLPRPGVDTQAFVRRIRSTSVWWLRRRLFAPERGLFSVTATVADGALVVDAPEARRVEVHMTHDHARTFMATEVGDGASVPDGATWFVTAEFDDGGRAVVLSSEPVLAPGFSPFVPSP